MTFIFYFLILSFTFLFKVSFLNLWFSWLPLVLIILTWLTLSNSKKQRPLLISAYLVGLFIDAQSNYAFGLTALGFILLVASITSIKRYFFSKINAISIITFGLITPVIFRLFQWFLANIKNILDKMPYHNFKIYFNNILLLEMISGAFLLLLIYLIFNQNGKEKNLIFD